MPTLTFSEPLNVSIQPGDMVYTAELLSNQAGRNNPSMATGVDTSPKKYGVVTTVNHQNRSIFVAAPFGGVTISSGSYIFFSKDNRVNTSGMVGYFAETEYRNYSKLPAEMFATSVNYVESSK